MDRLVLLFRHALPGVPMFAKPQQFALYHGGKSLPPPRWSRRSSSKYAEQASESFHCSVNADRRCSGLHSYRSHQAPYWAAVINGVISAPIMFVMIRMAASPKIMGQLISVNV